ncbi:C2 domain-containing protein [Mycena sanguinolenta]|uniref:C2 domain-containing protein n=1 Tax=Mycena sanguinolenta TaxID=230812 RepID=A0A8H7DL42_9AGAR|nr:C2 domain-containing protein [Mycena sanguinolenta]
MAEEVGTLVVVVLKAKDLNDKYFWKQDVFAQIGLNGENHRTKVDVKGGQHPFWDEEIRIPIIRNTGDKFRKLDVSCWAKEPRKEDKIGQGYVDLTETLKTGEFDDWVPLEMNGVSRGEVYLEMTYFANAPASVGQGLVVPQANLQRRPSKLSPAERMARPPYVPPAQRQQQDPQRQQDPLSRPSNGQPPHGLSPPSSRPHSTSPPRTGRESPLPPVPHEQPSTGLAVPSTLTPGRPKGQGPQHVPSILRPRNPKSSPTPIPGPAVEYTSVIPAPGNGGGSPPRTYTPVIPPPESPSHIPHLPDQWGSNDAPGPGGFSFPVPNIPGAREPTVEFSTSPPPPAGYGAHHRHGSGGSISSFSPPPLQHPPPPSFQPPPPSFQPTPPPFQTTPPPFQPTSPPFQGQPQSFQPPPSFQQPSFQSPPSFQPPPSFQHPPPAFPPHHPQPPTNNRSNELPDPYLLLRYQSPLPLPPGAEPSPLPKDQPASKPDPGSHNNPDNARLQALKQVEDEAARRRADEKREKELAQKRAEEEAQRKEEEARRRKEEEARRKEEEARRKEEEARRKEEEARRKEEEARRRKEEEARRRKEEEARRRKEQEDQVRLRALKQAEDEAARRRAQERKDHELALKALEEEKQRAEQEERDRELARQLDRELNLGAADDPPRVPGQW